MRWLNLEQEEQRRRDDELKRLREQTKALQAELDKFRGWVECFVDFPSNDFPTQYKGVLPPDMAEYVESVRVQRIHAIEEARRRAEAEKAARVKQLKTELAGMDKRRATVEKELGELQPA